MPVLHPINISKPAGREKTQGSHWELNPGPPALAAGALATELRLPRQLHSSFKGDRQPHTQSDAQGVYRDN